MEFTTIFIQYFFIGILFTSPILVTISLFIILLGHFVGKIEGWSHINALYYSFITATTVGYGDFPPRHKRSKMLAIVIAFCGLLLTGIVVAIALHALDKAFEDSDRITKVMTKYGIPHVESEIKDK